MMGRLETLLREMCTVARNGCLHIGLTLLLVMPQPAATARLFLSENVSIPETLEQRPSEELLSGHHHATEAPRCRRCIYLPVPRTPGHVRAAARALLETLNEVSTNPFANLRRDQHGAGVRSIC